MAIQTKAFPFAVKEIEGRTVTGIFSVFGNRDSGGDRIMPGAFTKTLQEQAGRIRHLWNHRGENPPIAAIRSIRQIAREKLPAEVLNYAPDATGGVEVTREYLLNPLAEWVLEALKKDAINEMSFAFETLQASHEEETDAAGNRIFTRQIRELRLYETSDVNWGMNPATTGVRALPVEAISEAMKSLRVEAKSLDFNFAEIEGIRSLCDELLAEREQIKERSGGAPLSEFELAGARLRALCLAA